MPSATICPSSRPSGGAHGSAATRRRIAVSSTAVTSSSRRTRIAARVAVASSLLTRAACAGSDSQAPTRAETRARMTLSRTTSADRKFDATNDSRLRPSASLRVGMIAVCGIGSPSGERNSAVTANQSASPPTIAASAPALTKPSDAAVVAGERVGDDGDDEQASGETLHPPQVAASPQFVRSEQGGGHIRILPQER